MRRLIGPAVLFMVLAAPGLTEDPGQLTPHNDAFTPGPQSESALARRVRHNLLTLPYYSIFDDLAFQVNGSVVTLEGACPPEVPWDIKADAEHAVKGIEGVTRVVNHIKLLPLSPLDWQIRRAEARMIYGDPEIGTRYGFQALPSIHIIVDNGHVTLEGVVDNQFDDTLIRTRANTVPNVFSVTDHLRVMNRGQKKKS